MSTPTVVNISPGSSIPSKAKTYVVEKELGEGGFGNVYKVKTQNENFFEKSTYVNLF